MNVHSESEYKIKASSAVDIAEAHSRARKKVSLAGYFVHNLPDLDADTLKDYKYAVVEIRETKRALRKSPSRVRLKT